MNSVNLIGSLTHEPQLRVQRSGQEVCWIRIAVRRRGSGGDPEPGVVYVDVKAFGQQARACAARLATGLRVAVSGRLELEQWVTAAGVRRFRHEVLADAIEFLDDDGPAAEEALGEID